MARRAKERPHERDEHTNTPSQQDEADILEEVGAKPDENGTLTVPEDTIREIGAVDAESVRENRRLEAIANKKRANMPGVPFNTNDPIVIYETLLKVWPANTIDIHVRRLTGSPVQHVIISRPRSGTELYEALKGVHGQHPEADYEVKFNDTSRKEYRGTGRITMPDMRATAQQGQPMTHPYYPQVPPGFPPPAPYAAPPQYPQPPPVVQPPAQPAPQQQPMPQPQPPPTVQVLPQTFDPNQMFGWMQQMFGMFKQMQDSAQPPPQPQAPPQPPAMMPPPPSPQAGPAEMMAWTQQLFGLFQQMMAAQQPPQSPATSRGAPQQPQMPNPMMMGMGMPPVQPPPGTMWVPGFGFVPLDRLMQAVGIGGGSGPGQGPGPGGGPSYRPRPAYYPQGEQGPSPYPGSGSHNPPPSSSPQRPQTAAEQFREAMSVVRTAVDVVQEMNSLLPSQGEQPTGVATAIAPEEDDSPVQIIDAGPAKLVVNKEDGTLRKWETGWANMDKVLKWVGEQHEKMQQAAQQQQQQQQRPQQLPPGYVEVRPGYQPPPGYVAVPVDPQQLPPPPEQMPPPIQEAPQQQQPSRRTWSAPTIPTEGES